MILESCTNACLMLDVNLVSLLGQDLDASR
jgi:hypothetical protein